MKQKSEKSGRQVFWFSLGISLFLFLTAAGLVAVDCQGRRLSFGDDTPPFQTVGIGNGRTALEIRLLGAETRVDVTGIHDFLNFLLDFGCIPHK